MDGCKRIGNMGPWGFGTFEDELACDWLEDLYDSDPVAFFEQCLDLDHLDYLEYLAGIGVICTSEVIHGLSVSPREGLPGAFHHWVKVHHDLDVSRFLSSAISAMRRLIGPDSEMRERWDDNAPWGELWFQHAADLLQRLEVLARDSQNRRWQRPGREDQLSSGHHG